MSNPNPYENYSQNPEWQNNQPPPPQPGYAPTQYQQPGAYLPPTQYQQPGAYLPPTQYQQPGMYPPLPPYSPYGVPAAPPDRGSGFAIAGLVLGIVSIVAAILPICGFPVSIVGIVMAALGRRSLSRRTMATVGLVLSIIGIVLAVLSAIYGVYSNSAQ
jgi:hypothetical protein